MPVTLSHLEHPAAQGEQAPPLLIAHGLFGSARNFNTLGRRLATTRRVVMVDMRNHGAAPWNPDNSYPALAGDLAEAVERLCDGRAVVLGHSMGGKAAMTLALTRPELLAGLIVADIAPVPHNHSHLNYIEAMQAVDLAQVTRRSEAGAMLAGAVPEPMLRGFLLQNLNVEGGRASWRLNLAALEANMAPLLDFPTDLPEAAYEGPAFFLHGGASPYVAPETHPRIRALFPDAEIEALPGAGHWLHAEQPEAFLGKVEGWL
ncbi:MAG: alpha/beta fold hydrolase, partial [Proteobacteria bacterium]|nr:alpha/beta fold hydrolase [Pseudomonadota bacterium]